MKTLRGVFPHVQVWLEEWPLQSERMTYVISASRAAPIPGKLTAQQGFNREWQEFGARLHTVGTAFDAIPELTDDLAPVERLLSDLIFSTAGR